MKRILFPCTRNSRRSQVTEALADDPPELAKAERTREAALAHDRRVRDEIGVRVKTLPKELAAHG